MSRYIALDAEQGQLYLASVIVKGSTIKLEKAISVPNNGALTLENAGDFGRRIKEAIKSAGIAPAPLVVSVGRERVVLKEIKYPAGVAAADEPALVRFQVSKELAEGGEGVVIDYFALPGVESDGQRRALAFAVRKDLLNACKTAAIASGLKLAALTPRPFGIAASLVRAIKDGAVAAPESMEAPIAILVRGDKWGELVITRGGNVSFSRPLTALALNSEQAMLGEIRRNLAVAAGQSSQPVAALFVAEGDMPGGWSGRLRAGLTVPVQAFDPIGGVTSDVAPESRGAFAGLAGLAYLRARSNELPVNFIEPREPKVVADPNKKMLAIVSLILVVLMVPGIGFLYMMANKKVETAQSLAREKVALENELKNHDDMMKRIKAVKDWEDKGINWLEELYETTDRFPKPDGTQLVQFLGKPAAETKGSKYVAEIEMQIQTEGGNLVDELATSMATDHHYGVGGKLSKGPVTGGGFGNRFTQQFSLKVAVERRMTNQYTRHLKVGEGPTWRDKVRERQNDAQDGMVGGFGGGMQ